MNSCGFGFFGGECKIGAKFEAKLEGWKTQLEK